MVVDLTTVLQTPAGTDFKDIDETGWEKPLTMKRLLQLIAQSSDQEDCRLPTDKRIFWGDLSFRLYANENEITLTAEEIKTIKERATKTLQNNLLLWALVKSLESLKST